MHVLWTAKDESLIRIVIWRNVIGLFIIWNYRAERSNHPSFLVLWCLFPFDCAVLMSAAGLQECLQCLCWSSLSSQGPIVCYLCKEEIKADLWYSGDHRWASHYKVRLWSARSRRGCASRQTVQLSMLPSHPAVDCTHCDRRLRLWPDQEMAFTCDQCQYESSSGWDVVRSSNTEKS